VAQLSALASRRTLDLSVAIDQLESRVASWRERHRHAN